MNSMKTIYVLGVVGGMALMPAAAGAGERLGDAALGAVAGGVVAGPVGAVAGGAIGYTAGPRIAHRMGVRHRHRHVRHSRSERQAAR